MRLTANNSSSEMSYLVWKYNRKSDSVLEVTKQDYDECNTRRPIATYKDGNTKMTLEHSGAILLRKRGRGALPKGAEGQGHRSVTAPRVERASRRTSQRASSGSFMDRCLRRGLRFRTADRSMDRICHLDRHHHGLRIGSEVGSGH
ncbi:hypothetical protein MLD38_006698 [Melastoma candidum]|uniref:Uncharacterized protein n=1 Tax=Melastoma candidum TaxID=119954 RepID=A0ACB9RNQ9_9MYRT|nr:hypothetical protein MLD38_006698 [Melastoma candidum]